MHEAAAVTALAVTLGLALRRPVLLPGVRVGPGIAAGAGVLMLILAGPLRLGDVAEAVRVLWGPMLALASIMVMIGVAARVGPFQRLAELVLIAPGLCWRHRAGGPVETVRTAVAWEVIIFLSGMYLLAKGLQHIGVVDQLRHLYRLGGILAVAGISAAGSAMITTTRWP